MKSNPLRLLVAFCLSILAGRLAAANPDAGPQLGLQTWTCRNMTFDQVVDFATRHHIKYLEFIAAHLNPNAPPAENLRKKAVLDQHGLVAYSFGVNPTSLDKESNRRLFEFARLMGIKLIIVEPKDLAQWDNLEELVKEYDIKLAIHNHGKGSDLNADPANVRRILAARDPRIGVCLDIGWVTAAGFDAAEVFREYGDRVFDLHFKDKKAEEADGKTQWADTLPGEGDANLAGLFAEIRRTGWSGVMAVETDSKAFAADPNELMDRSAEYFRAHLAGPGAPLNLFLPPQTATEGSITLMWDKPEAYADVADYVIFCDGRQVAVTSKTNGTVGGLEPDHSHSFYVEARDNHGRVSAPSRAIAARTRPVGANLNILAYGAVGDGRTKNTAAIQRAIEACPAGGTVVVPSGVFLSGALFLKSDLTLLVEAGGRLQGTTDVADYEPMIRSRFEGWEMDTFASLINAGRLDHAGPYNVRNIAIRGEGEIRGGGNALAHAMIAAGGMRSRGRLICIVNCSGLDLQGLTIDDPPCWTIQYVYSEKISCHDLTIRSTVANGDGMDPDSSRDCFIFNCSFSNGDDCIAIKSGKNPEGNQIGRPTENVRITDCAFPVGHGISIGSEISGSVRHVLVRDCDTGNLLNGLQIKGTPERGGVVEDVRVQDCRVRKIRILTKLGYNNDGAAAPEAPYFKNFTFVNIDLRQAGVSSPVIVVDGYDDGRHRTRDLLFQDLELPDGASVDVDQCENVKFIDVASVDGTKPAYHVTRSQAVDN